MHIPIVGYAAKFNDFKLYDELDLREAIVLLTSMLS